MDFSLTAEQELIIESTREFVQRELLPHEDLVEEADEVPDELYEQVKQRALEQGLYAADIPTKYGGGGLDPLSFTLLERELGWASYALQYIVHRPCNILQAERTNRSRPT